MNEHDSPTPRAPRRRHGCLIALAILLSIGAIVVVAGIVAGPAIADALAGFGGEPAYGEDEFPDLEEVWSFGSGSNKVVCIAVRGMITLDEEGGFFTEPGSTLMALHAIRRATLDTDVRGIILDVDSGGGGITASDVLYHALKRFRASREDRRIVAFCGDVAASGAYYIALAADHIVARPTTITGSIGVIMQSLNMKGLGEKLGIADVTIKSGPNKDLLNPLSELTAEQRAMLQHVVDNLHTRFVSLVTENRRLPEPDVRAIADGRILLAQDAVQLGLMDEVGYWEDAMTRIADLLVVDRVIVYRYEQTFSLSAFFRARGGAGAARALERVLTPRTDSPLHYRWAY